MTPLRRRDEGQKRGVDEGTGYRLVAKILLALSLGLLLVCTLYAKARF